MNYISTKLFKKKKRPRCPAANVSWNVIHLKSRGDHSCPCHLTHLNEKSVTHRSLTYKLDLINTSYSECLHHANSYQSLVCQALSWAQGSEWGTLERWRRITAPPWERLIQGTGKDRMDPWREDPSPAKWQEGFGLIFGRKESIHCNFFFTLY